MIELASCSIRWWVVQVSMFTIGSRRGLLKLGTDQSTMVRSTQKRTDMNGLVGHTMKDYTPTGLWNTPYTSLDTLWYGLVRMSQSTAHIC